MLRLHHMSAPPPAPLRPSLFSITTLLHLRGGSQWRPPQDNSSTPSLCVDVCNQGGTLVRRRHLTNDSKGVASLGPTPGSLCDVSYFVFLHHHFHPECLRSC